MNEQVVTILREADRKPVGSVASKHGISEQTICTWRQRFGTFRTDEERRLKQREAENARLDKLVAERDLEIEVMKEFVAENGAHADPPCRSGICDRQGPLTTWTPDGNVFGMFKIMKVYMPESKGAPPSPFEWGRPERVTELLGDAFDLKFERGTSYYREPNGLAAWETFVRGYGPLRALANRLDEATRTTLKEDFVDFHDSFASALGICVPREYQVVIGTRR